MTIDSYEQIIIAFGSTVGITCGLLCIRLWCKRMRRQPMYHTWARTTVAYPQTYSTPIPSAPPQSSPPYVVYIPTQYPQQQSYPPQTPYPSYPPQTPYPSYLPQTPYPSYPPQAQQI